MASRAASCVTAPACTQEGPLHLPNRPAEQGLWLQVGGRGSAVWAADLGSPCPADCGGTARAPLRQPSAWRFLCGCSNEMGGGGCQSKSALGGGCDCVHTISTAWPRGYHYFNQVREKLNLLSPQLLLRLHVCVRAGV